MKQLNISKNTGRGVGHAVNQAKKGYRAIKQAPKHARKLGGFFANIAREVKVGYNEASTQQSS